ncbi:hypothetical protein D9M69_514470 [compost metagenome]
MDVAPDVAAGLEAVRGQAVGAGAFQIDGEGAQGVRVVEHHRGHPPLVTVRMRPRAHRPVVEVGRSHRFLVGHPGVLGFGFGEAGARRLLHLLIFGDELDPFGRTGGALRNEYREALRAGAQHLHAQGEVRPGAGQGEQQVAHREQLPRALEVELVANMDNHPPAIAGDRIEAQREQRVAGRRPARNAGLADVRQRHLQLHRRGRRLVQVAEGHHP